MPDIRQAVILLAAVGCAACSPECANDIMNQIPAPDGRHVAVLFQRGCGATTGVNWQVSVLDRGQSPTGTGNAFIADLGSGMAPGRDRPVRLMWKGSDELNIWHDSRMRIFKSETHVSSIRVIAKSGGH